MNEFMFEALDYVKRGWSVIPLLPYDKTPYSYLLPCIYEHGHVKHSWAQFQRVAASDLRVTAWWTEARLSNVGIVTGKVSNLFVLDCDSASAVAQARERGIPVSTPTVTTRNGVHFYFIMPEFALGNRVKFQPGMDVRAECGYVVAPPSIHPSRIRYFWQSRQREPTFAPNWLLDLLRPQPIQRPPNPTERLQIKHGDRYAKSAFNSEYRSVLYSSEGERNNTLNRACYNLGQLIADGLLDRSEVETAMLSAALSVGQNEREARATIASGVGDGMENPRSTRPYVAQRR